MGARPDKGVISMRNRTVGPIRSILSARPWLLCDDDPTAGGGGGGTGSGPNGFPEATPVAEMSAEHQAAYWKHQSRKHEAQVKAGPDAAEVQRLRDRDAALTARENEALTEAQRVQAAKEAADAEAASAKANAAAAQREALVLRVAMDKGLTTAQADRLQGSTKEELEADAAALLALFPTAGTTQRQPLGSGSDVGNAAKTITAGAARYAARHPKS